MTAVEIMTRAIDAVLFDTHDRYGQVITGGNEYVGHTDNQWCVVVDAEISLVGLSAHLASTLADAIERGECEDMVRKAQDELAGYTFGDDPRDDPIDDVTMRAALAAALRAGME